MKGGKVRKIGCHTRKKKGMLLHYERGKVGKIGCHTHKQKMVSDRGWCCCTYLVQLSLYVVMSGELHSGIREAGNDQQLLQSSHQVRSVCWTSVGCWRQVVLQAAVRAVLVLLTHACTHIHAHTYAHTQACTHTYAHTHVHAHSHTCMHVRMHMHTHTHTERVGGEYRNHQRAKSTHKGVH